MGNIAMKTFSRLLLAFILTAIIPTASSAQEYESTPVAISKDKVRVDGTICYSHIVLERQTLFSISKAYNVSIEDIYKYNPSVKEEGLKKNSILIIPVEDGQPAAPVETEATETVQATEMAVPETQQAERIHVVKWFEDLDVIAEKYGVTVEAIMKANGLKGRKLSRRQQLVIPSSEITEDQGEIEEVQATDETGEAADEETDDSNQINFGWLFPDREVSVSLLLPLKATGSSSSQNNMDFYSGVLLATYDLAAEGVKTDLSVYDVADGNFPVTQERLQSSDLVIGPISSSDLGRVFEMAPDAKAVISPLDPKAESLVSTHTNMIQAPVPHRLQYEDLAAWIKEDTQYSDKVLVITEKGARASEAVSLMTAAIDSTGISYSPFSYSILEGRNVTDPISSLMTENGTNRVLIASESEAFVNDVVRNLNLLIHKKYNIVLYAPSKIRSFETIEVENFHNTKFHVSLGYYIDYSDKKVMDFIMKYRALYNTEPSQFAFQGYDIANYFIRLFAKYGDRWPSKIDSEGMSMLQSTFRYSKNEDEGYINTGVRRIVYEDDWSVRKVR
ncbi:MAG: LysM peptidoglycan-binding domain-containing protein [Bacteroidales bacterium]|nr:LysM peptidoglycan-binding domain-containing protein [Bacteroidales bacterium]